MPIDVEITGAAELARKLNINLENELQPALLAVAAVLQNEIAPYPPAPPKNPDRWYERGYGPRWRRKRGGGIGGRKTSQLLNRSWAVEPRGQNEVLLTNRATYTKWVHLDQYQTRVHQQTGWVTDRMGIQQATASGDIVRVIDRALAHILPVKE